MASILEIGISGLNAFQQALTTTANNIANANDPSYTRLRPTLQQRVIGGIGSGVDVAEIDRLFDQFAINNVRTAITNFNRNDTYQQKISSFEKFVEDPSINIANTTQQLFTALNAVNNAPTSTTSRGQLYNQLQYIVSNFQAVNSEINRQHSLVTSELNGVTEQVNTLTQALAKVNQQILSSTGTNNNGLYDVRDEAVRQLSELIDVNVYQNTDGTVLVSLASGNPLVQGQNASSLALSDLASNPQLAGISINANSTSIDITQFISGGKLGGLLAYRNQTLEPALNSIGRLAVAMSDQFNQQNALGVDLNGQIGGNIFNDINSTTAQTSRVVANTNNGGLANLSVRVTSSNALTDSNYTFSVAAGNYSLTRLSDNTVVASGAIAIPSTISAAADGFQIDVPLGATFINGDTYLVAPTRSGAQLIGVAAVNANKIALASPIQTSASLSNVGTGVINNVTIQNNSSFTGNTINPPLTIQFTTPTTYSIINATTTAVIAAGLAYNPAVQNTLVPAGAFTPGYTITMTGTPQTNDQFSVGYNGSGTGDNRNGLLLAQLQQQRVLDNSRTTFQEQYLNMMGTISNTTSFLNSAQKASQAVLTNAINGRNQLSGVNLDEEAANLSQYQNLYQASAKVVAVGNTVFETILTLIQ